MTPRERVLAALSHEQPDRVPRDFWAEPPTWNGLLAHTGLGAKLNCWIGSVWTSGTSRRCRREKPDSYQFARCVVAKAIPAVDCARSGRALVPVRETATGCGGERG